MFKAVSTPLPNLKDWRFSVDARASPGPTFDREGESQNSLGRRPIEELTPDRRAQVEAGARSRRDHRGLVIMSGKESGFIVGADIREFDRLSDRAGRDRPR